MRKIFLGIFIGAAITSGIFYFIIQNQENEQKEELASLITRMKQKEAASLQADEAINDPNAILAVPSALSILLVNENFYYYRDNDCEKMKASTLDALTALLREEVKQKKPGELMIMIKQVPGASVKNAVGLLDVITIAGVPPGHFAEVNLSEKEKNCIKKI